MKTSVARTSVFLGAIALIAVLSSVFILTPTAEAEETDAVNMTPMTTTETTPTETTAAESTAADTTTAANDTDIDVPALMQDRVMGSPDAPVTVIEYASMTCMHCASFHNTVLPTVKQDLIDEGKLRYVFREFPLDAVALRASMMARCADEDKFFGLLDVLFANQKRWVGADDPVAAMSQLGKLAGLSDERLDACLANDELETAVLKNRQDAASEYQVRATPSFVFNNGAAVESGVIPAEDFEQIVDRLSR